MCSTTQLDLVRSVGADHAIEALKRRDEPAEGREGGVGDFGARTAATSGRARTGPSARLPGAHARPAYPVPVPLAPEPTLAVAVTSADHVRGPVAAPVTIVEYGDYECPYCAAAAPVLAAVLKARAGRVRLVFRNFPLPDVHPYALTAALAAEAAAALARSGRCTTSSSSGRTGSRRRSGRLRREAGTRRVGGGRRRGPAVRRQGGGRLRRRLDTGVGGTPTLFIDGRRYTGRVDAARCAAA